MEQTLAELAQLFADVRPPQALTFKVQYLILFPEL